MEYDKWASLLRAQLQTSHMCPASRKYFMLASLENSWVCESSWPEERWKVKIQSGPADTIVNLGPENLDSPLLSIIHFPNNYGALNILAADREQEMLWEQWELPNHHRQSKLFVFFHRLNSWDGSVSKDCALMDDDLGHDGSINILSREHWLPSSAPWQPSKWSRHWL